MSTPPAPCPACGHDRATVRWQRGAEQVWRCARCGLMYRDPAHHELRLDAAQRAALPGYRDLVEAHELRVTLERARIARLQTSLGRLGIELRGSRLLDVGAATGTLGQALAEAGLEVDYLGLEPDPVLRARAAGHVALHAGEVDTAALPAGAFDVVVLCDVLEHVPAPVATMQRVHGWLRPGGAVYVEVPDESQLDRRAALRRALGGGGDPPTHPAHLSLFDRHTLAETLHKARFRGIDVYAVSIFADARRLQLATGAPSPLARTTAAVFRWTGVDRSLGQGALMAYART